MVSPEDFRSKAPPEDGSGSGPALESEGDATDSFEKPRNLRAVAMALRATLVACAAFCVVVLYCKHAGLYDRPVVHVAYVGFFAHASLAYTARCLYMEAGYDEELIGLYHMVRFGTFVFGFLVAFCPLADEFATGTMLHTGESGCFIILNLRPLFTVYNMDSSSRFPISDTAMSVISVAAAALRLAVTGNCWTAGDAMLSVCIFVIAVAVSDAVREGVDRYQSRLKGALKSSQEKQVVIELGRADLQDAHDLLGEERRGTGQILSAVCDCSFKMSDELCLTDPTPQLHDLLCCGGSPNDLFGRCVDGFMSEGDSQRLRESVARARAAGVSARGAAAKLPLELAVAGKRVPVELYHAPLNKLDHIVAICRREDAAADASPQTSSGGAAAGSADQPDEESGERRAEDRAWIEFDAAHPNLRVYDGSEEFRGFAGAGLLDWIRSTQRGRVSHWVRRTYDAIESAREGAEVRTEKLLYFELNLNLATVVARKTWLECFTREGGRGGADRPARLWMEDLTVHWKPIVEGAGGAAQGGDAASEVDIHDSFSQVGHLFFISNKP